MTIIRDAVRAIKTMSGRWLYVDDRNLWVECLDHAADWPAWDGSTLDEKGRIVEAEGNYKATLTSSTVVEVEPPPYEPTAEEEAWWLSQDAIMPWLRMSPEEIEADRRETLERLRREDEMEAAWAQGR